MTISDDLHTLTNLFEKLYLETKYDKFLKDAISLEQWIWTLSQKEKEKWNIQFDGSPTASKVLARINSSLQDHSKEI